MAKTSQYLFIFLLVAQLCLVKIVSSRQILSHFGLKQKVKTNFLQKYHK
mgnify:CR=1 FL=1